MTILNKRNAILGWSVWQVAKRQAKRKAKPMSNKAPGANGDRRLGKKTAVAAAAAAGGALLFWRRRSSGDGSDSKS
jgi:hypothetical protein